MGAVSEAVGRGDAWLVTGSGVAAGELGLGRAVVAATGAVDGAGMGAGKGAAARGQGSGGAGASLARADGTAPMR
jgi:hypothetical protein